ncbi:hypothetical protein RJ640_010471 [Escallonia rubra]|uniref:S-protein homolog n=1 Tax=Escallonia rubra TaxID=112253 RepID=A0AA88RDC0_9ASTE|nr:hypothetical protein RJ640_010471 [Escallonia rubra]
MAPVMKILYLLMIIAFSFACTTWARYSYPTYELHVISRIPQSYPPLTIRCQSKDDDLGYHTLYAGDDFHWHFRSNAIGTTLYFCHFWWDSKQKVFDVFNMKVWADKCKGALQTTNMRRKIGIVKSWRLLHVDWGGKIAMKECIFHIKLPNFPTTNSGNCKNGADISSILLTNAIRNYGLVLKNATERFHSTKNGFA